MSFSNSRKHVRNDLVKTPKKNIQIPAINYLRQLGIKLGQTIGEGSYCKVKIALCYDKKSKQFTHRFACKMIDKQRASSDFINKFLPRELKLLKQLARNQLDNSPGSGDLGSLNVRKFIHVIPTVYYSIIVTIVCSIKHPHIVSVLYALELHERVYIFMDLCEKGDLLEFVRNNGALYEHKAKRYFKQMVSAIDYLHSKDIAHRDLKCENILLTSKDNIKIGDFGFARMCRDPFSNTRVLSQTFCGSAAYAAPEVLQGIAYNPKMYDVWSLGCILFIMLFASMPFDDSDIQKMLRIQKNRLLEFPINVEQCITKPCRKLIMHLLEPDITRRATIKQTATSNWLREKQKSV